MQTVYDKQDRRAESCTCENERSAETCRREKYCCGAFSVGNMEMVRGAIRAAEELDTPIILQIAEVRLKNSPLHLMGPMMVQAAKEAKVDVAVHLDHGLTFGTVDKALELGFTSVMLDASTLPFEENIARVKAVVEKARKYGATVEAELGLVGGSEDGSCDHGIRCTDPDDAVVYARETGIDALAVAIGNAHGNYPVAPTLAFDVLEKIHERVDIPLVLHGGSGITDKDFQKAISLGIRKVNIATASFNSLTAHVEKYMESTDKHNFFDLNEAMVQYLRECEETYSCI